MTPTRAPLSGRHRNGRATLWRASSRSNSTGRSKSTTRVAVRPMSWTMTGAGRSMSTVLDSSPGRVDHVIAQRGAVEAVAHHVHLAGVGIELGVSVDAGRERAAEVARGDGVQVARRLVGQRPLGHGKDPAAVVRTRWCCPSRDTTRRPRGARGTRRGTHWPRGCVPSGCGTSVAGRRAGRRRAPSRRPRTSGRCRPALRTGWDRCGCTCPPAPAAPRP